MKKIYKKPQTVEAAQLLLEYAEHLEAETKKLRKQACSTAAKARDIRASIPSELEARVEEKEEMDRIWSPKLVTNGVSISEYKHEADVE